MAVKLIEYKLQDNKIKKRLNEAGFFSGLAKGIKKGIAQQFGIELPQGTDDFLKANNFKEATISGWKTTICYKTRTNNHDILLIGNKDNNKKLYFMVDGVVIPTSLMRYILDNIPSNLDNMLDKLCSEVKNLTESVLLEDEALDDATTTDGLTDNTVQNEAEVNKNQSKVESVDMSVIKDFDNQHWTKLQPELQKANINPFSQPFNRLAIRKDVSIGFNIDEVNKDMLDGKTNSDNCTQFIDCNSANAVYSSAKTNEDLATDVGKTAKGYNRGQLCISYINKLLTGKAMSINKASGFNKNQANANPKDKLLNALKKSADYNAIETVIKTKGGFDTLYKDFSNKNSNTINSWNNKVLYNNFLNYLGFKQVQ